MGKLRNKWGHDREVPGFGVVEADGLLNVPDGLVEGFACQSGWEPDDAATLKTYEKAVKARRDRLDASRSAERDASGAEGQETAPKPSGGK